MMIKSKEIRAFVMIILSIPALLILFCVYIFFINNYVITYLFAQTLYDYPLPPNTTIIRQERELIHPVNGNWCSTRAVQEISTSLSRQDIQKHYKDLKYAPAKPDIFNTPLEIPKVMFIGSSDGMKKFRITIEQSTNACTT